MPWIGTSIHTFRFVFGPYMRFVFGFETIYELTHMDTLHMAYLCSSYFTIHKYGLQHRICKHGFGMVCPQVGWYMCDDHL